MRLNGRFIIVVDKCTSSRCVIGSMEKRAPRLGGHFTRESNLYLFKNLYNRGSIATATHWAGLFVHAHDAKNSEILQPVRENRLLWVTITLKRYRSLKRAISSFNSKVAFMGFFIWINTLYVNNNIKFLYGMMRTEDFLQWFLLPLMA